jgi:hypothetical protein
MRRTMSAALTLGSGASRERKMSTMTTWSASVKLAAKPDRSARVR